MAVDFESLCDLYNSNDLVIIVGSELLKIKENNLTFEQQVIEQIAKKKYNFVTCPKTFSELAIKEPKVDSTRIKGVFNQLENKNEFNTDLLSLLADLPNVKLFISTAYDMKLEKLLGIETESIMWNHKIKEPIYLNLQNGKKKVFYLFGNVSESISLFEEELIDSLMSLASYNEVNKSKTQDRYSFLEHLKNKTLIFIGNNFPDWFMRLMIRTLYNAPVTVQYNKAYIINDKNTILNFEKYFFEKYKIDLIHDFPIEDFLKDLHNNIREQQSFDDWYKPKEVFISYDRQNIKFAQDLKSCLNTRHVSAFFDIEDMKIAEHKKKIISRLSSKETCIIVCIISENLSHKETEKSYVKEIEWSTAEARYNANEFLATIGPKPSPFVVIPIAIDDYKIYFDKLPLFITKNNILTYSLPAICNLIEEEIKSIKL